MGRPTEVEGTLDGRIFNHRPALVIKYLTNSVANRSRLIARARLHSESLVNHSIMPRNKKGVLGGKMRGRVT